ncbi:MAG: trimethylamine corrinoid protein 2 [Lentisphaeria bacterium]|nr:trimethylamine corrinoid protein 2 [Lentisphaeria bacterium]
MTGKDYIIPDETRARFEAWWQRSSIGRPMLSFWAPRDKPLSDADDPPAFVTAEQQYTDVDLKVRHYRHFLDFNVPMAEAFPNFGAELGPGAMALYLGSEPVFAWDTLWFNACVSDWDERGELRFDPDNHWWQVHLKMIRHASELAAGDFLVNIPDIIENVDILAALRGPQNFCFDLIDEGPRMKRCVEQIDDLYFTYYDAMYDIVKAADGSSSYTCFQIWGPGRTAKIQCDFCAMMSPKQFTEFVQDSLRKQCRRLDNSLYHLDGPDAIKHVDALMEIEELDALQWTCGAGQPDGGSECWYPIYEKVRTANKSLHISLADGTLDDGIRAADRLVNRLGSDGLYLLFHYDISETAGRRLIEHAEKHWG